VCFSLIRESLQCGLATSYKCAKEGDRIPPLESYGQPLEQEHRLSCVLGGCGGASANFLDQFNYYYYYYYVYY